MHGYQRWKILVTEHTPNISSDEGGLQLKQLRKEARTLRRKKGLYKWEYLNLSKYAWFMNKKYFYWLFYLLLSCKPPQCVQDKAAIEQFGKKISIIKSYEEEHAEVNADAYREALVFLSDVTG